MKSIRFNADTLKLIAIFAMTLDHISWGFLDFYTLPAQILHIIGRLTIPIMCFFIAEGYHHTKDLKKYILRLVLFALISIIPFYLFFGKMYHLRQNILFDLLFGLLALTVIHAEPLNKYQKGFLITVLFIISISIGGWPVVPMVFIIIFDRFRNDFKKIILGIVSTILLLETALIIAFSQIPSLELPWYHGLYLMGFSLALPLLFFYNKKRSNSKAFKWLFYCYYPLHFLILYGILTIIN